jgi:alkylation response protein AidB-like acyl-CoA dehydrogenase
MSECGPSDEALLSAARGLAPAITEAADEIERERRLPDPLVTQLYEQGLFTMLVPASLGGTELDLLSFARVIEELARADGSVAWCVGQANGLGAYTAYLDPTTARSIFNAGQRCILANGPGIGNRPGRADPDPSGGFRINGRWTFASGCQHANWLVALCQLHDAQGQPRTRADGGAELRQVLVPADAVEFEDTWHVSGLRGTGSHTFAIHDYVVPHAYAIHVDASSRFEPGPLYLFTSSGMFGPAFASVAIGLADTSLREVTDLAAGKTPRGFSRTLRESATVQAGLARARARLKAARAYLHQALCDVWQAASQDGSVHIGQRVEVRLAATHAIHEAASVVDIAFEIAGSSAIFEDGPFARRFRDIHAVTQQVQARASHFETAGRYLVGLEPASQFL